MAKRSETTPNKHNQGQKNRNRPKNSPSYGPLHPLTDEERLISAFSACGRCGYFINSYRALVGLVEFSQLIPPRGNPLFVLPHLAGLERLLEGHYGFDLFAHDRLVNWACPECQRVFFWHLGRYDDEGVWYAEDRPTLRVQIIPRATPISEA